MPIQRITLFKVTSPQAIEELLQQYKTLASTHSKNGKPYILSCEATPTLSDARNQGYNLIARTRFENLEDMKYYDESCEAHGKLKEAAKGKIEPPPLTLYFEV